LAITSSYLVAVGKLEELLQAVRKAQAPERFTTRFLEELGFKSTNDRLFIGLLKALGFLDEGGTPQQRYFDYLDETQSKIVLAQGIQEAYEDLFRVNKQAHEMSQTQVKNKLKSLTQGQYSDNVLSNMSRTFVELVKFADFANPKPSVATKEPEAPLAEAESRESRDLPASKVDQAPRESNRRLIDALSYRIEVVLPPTRDKTIYDAIFRSLKEHLL